MLIWLYYMMGYFKKGEGATEVHTSSDVTDAVKADFTDSSSVSVDSNLDSEPVGRPRSCKTCERQN